jgi:hypothetical protein
MKPVRLIFVAVLLPLLLAACDDFDIVQKKELPPEDVLVDTWTTSLVEDFAAGRPDAALDRMVRRFQSEQGQDSAVAVAMEKARPGFRKISTRGTVLGWEVLVDEKPSPSIWKRYYVLKYGKDVAVLQFWFYKPHDTWIFYHVDSDITGIRGVEEFK